MPLVSKPPLARLIGSTFALIGCAYAQPEVTTGDEREPVRVLLLGSYHFGNPGQDVFNAEVDSVLTPQRQAELEALTEALLGFEPNVVAVERTAEAPYDDPVWADFDERMLREVPNERVQIGYRLADAAGIDRVYAIDEQPSEGEPDYFPYDELTAFTEETGRGEELEAVMSVIPPELARFEAALPKSTVPELLMMSNDAASYDDGDDIYWNVLAFGDGERQPGPELAAYWFMRNAKIFNKLAQVTEPGDRVVVVYGAGHNHWLRAMIERTDGYAFEPAMPYLERAADLAPPRE